MSSEKECHDMTLRSYTDVRRLLSGYEAVFLQYHVFCISYDDLEVRTLAAFGEICRTEEGEASLPLGICPPTSPASLASHEQQFKS
jgi:hypothetical protein